MKDTVEYTPTVASEGILLNANESSENLNQEMMQRIQDCITDVAFNRYPDPDETELLEAYGKVIGVKSSCLLAGNGSDQMLGYLISTYLGENKILYTLNPDFSMYDYYASTNGAKVVKFVQEGDGTWDLDAFITDAKEKKADMIMFSNPNNPSGTVITIEEVKKIMNAFTDIPVIVDEAYLEFSDAQSSIVLLDTYENLFVTKTLSKAYGLAGLRVGFLIGNEKVMKTLKSKFVPYALNAVSMKIASIVLEYPEVVKNRIAQIKQDRETIYEASKAFKHIQLYPSQGNFLKGRCDDKEKLIRLFSEANIAIRNYADSDLFRISIGNTEENQLVIQVLKQFEEDYL